MSITVMMAAGPENWQRYKGPLQVALKAAGIDAHLCCDAPPKTVDYLVYAPSSTLQDFTPYQNCKAVLSLWAGVERIVGNPTLTMPLCRMVDPALTEGMVEWVVGHALRFHLGLDKYAHNPQQIWDPTCPPLARERTVAILGAGALGAACARALQALNFPVVCWSRSPKAIAGLNVLHGQDGLRAVLAQAQIVVTLLPKTPETENTLNTQTLAWLPKGAAILNPGRGALIEDDALLAALDSGDIAHATLDVFRTEPLPRDHLFWRHPSVTVTPHIAADTRPETSSQVIAENIRRGEAGEAFAHLVDRTRGY